jgi:hypothetical protein
LSSQPSLPSSWSKGSTSQHATGIIADFQGSTKKSKLGATSSFEDEEHLLGILVSLFTNLASDTPERIRLLSKFVENDYEKVDRLLEMRDAAEGRLKAVNREIGMERKVSGVLWICGGMMVDRPRRSWRQMRCRLAMCWSQIEEGEGGTVCRRLGHQRRDTTGQNQKRSPKWKSMNGTSGEWMLGCPVCRTQTTFSPGFVWKMTG